MADQQEQLDFEAIDKLASEIQPDDVDDYLDVDMAEEAYFLRKYKALVS